MTGTEFNNKDGVSLKEYFDGKLAEIEKRLCMRIDAVEAKEKLVQQLSERAIEKAEASVNERLLIMNEFRNAMKDQQATFVTKDMYESKTSLSESELRKLQMSKAALDGKADHSTMQRTLLFAVISSLLGLAGFVFALINLLSH